ncbi:MAG: GNAT family N-acetyltransferase [Deltaproteobacteria bacterium]|nr:GNAT family N-acetyltransferase [Deltaproteobacteria bacterium]
MENFQVRRMDEKDLDEIINIYGTITNSPVPPEFKQVTQKRSLDEESACFVAELDGRIIGFMISNILTLGFGVTKSAWISNLGVNPEHMGQGIGKKMAEEVNRFYKIKGISHIYTSVRWDSTDMLSFFKTLGFERSDFINLQKTID